MTHEFCMKRCLFPCSLQRQDCLTGAELSRHLSLQPEMLTVLEDLPKPSKSIVEYVSAVTYPTHVRCTIDERDHDLSRFEAIITTYLPILENLLLHLPTAALYTLYHTSGYLRIFLMSYPLAWKNLSFRNPLHLARFVLDAPVLDGPERVESPRLPSALDLLLRVTVPHSTSLTRLDLDFTTASGAELHTTVLYPRRATLQHLSVRGCKDISIKYHLLPFLQMESIAPRDLIDYQPLALKSLYTHRCRHHRSRPYLPSSLTRRDSHSLPTHELVELCHRLGIWTDTAWCPTPGPRCFRRKDYYVGSAIHGETEVWVPFDRLWRSQNSIGCIPYSILDEYGELAHADGREGSYCSQPGRLWGDEDFGYAGEALGSGGYGIGEGKGVPVHLRRSHKMFIEGFKCDQCAESILERCEQCSVCMHCQGCRRTLCHSCAFDRPLPRKRARTSSNDRKSGSTEGGDRPTSHSRRRALSNRPLFWWAPGAQWSPNIAIEPLADDQFSNAEEINQASAVPTPHRRGTPRLRMRWCCDEPSFSDAGGIAVAGIICSDNVRAAPLPRGHGYENPTFSNCSRLPQHVHYTSSVETKWRSIDNSYHGIDIMPFLEAADRPCSPSTIPPWVSPRNLCNECWQTTSWKIPCGACQQPICIEHDVRTLKTRICGFRKLCTEQTFVLQNRFRTHAGLRLPDDEEATRMRLFHAKWRPIVAKMANGTVSGSMTSVGEQKQETRKLVELPRCPNPDAPCLQQPTLTLPSPSEAPHLRCRRKSTSDIIPSPIPVLSETTKPSLLELPTDPDIFRDYSHNPMPWSLLTAPWTGCYRYFCPSMQVPGNTRLRCPSSLTSDELLYISPEARRCELRMLECTICGVHVCGECRAACAGTQAGCTCRECSRAGFMCPNCKCSKDVVRRCCWVAEEGERRRKAAEEAERERKYVEDVRRKWEEGRADREVWEEIVEGIREVFEVVDVGMDGGKLLRGLCSFGTV